VRCTMQRASLVLAWLITLAWQDRALAQTAAPNATTRAAAEAEASFRQATEAVATGDIARAIAALERVLRANPDLANIKLELGLLYLRAGNADLARSYLRQAINAPDAPEAARTRARLALATAASASGGFSITGSLFANAQLQSNPNGSPGSISVTGPGGTPIIISGSALDIPRGTDLAFSVGTSVQIRHGLGNQRGHDIALDLGAAQTNFFHATDLDATYLSARLGPRFFTGAALAPTGYIRPLATGTLLFLGHDHYFSAFGGGVEFLTRPSLVTSLSGQIGYERRDYYRPSRRLTAFEQSGTYLSGNVEFALQLSPRTRASVSALFEKADTRAAYWSRRTWGGQAGITDAFAPSGGTQSWVARLSGSYRRSDYTAPDPLVNVNLARDEDRFDAEASLSIPLADFVSLDIRASQTWNNANLPNYKFTNTSGTISVSYRF
jgi:tetratricopeptide (TPR) repeat protein